MATQGKAAKSASGAAMSKYDVEVEKRLIELQSGAPYAAVVIQPPAVSEKPSDPNVFIRLVLGLIVGFGLGIVAVLIVAMLRRAYSQRRSTLA